MPVELIEITKPKLLIGEGEDEKCFFEELLKHLHIEDVQVFRSDGKDNLRTTLRTLTLTTGFRGVTSLGVTRDADGSIENDDHRQATSAQNAFKSVCGALLGAGLPKPSKPIEIASGTPNVSVFILPDCSGNGMLEDLCIASIENDPAFQCVDGFFTCAIEAAKSRPSNMSKARIHAWLATRKRPDLRFGEAAKKGIWDWEHPVFEPIRNFLLAL